MADFFYVFGSGDDEKEPKKDDDKNDNITIVEEKVTPAEPESPTLEELANSDFIRSRQLAAKSIVEHLHQAGSNKEALHSVISIMCKLSEDEDLMVRSELMDHIPSIALFCKEHPEDLGVVIRQQIVPYTVKLLTDVQRLVRKIGHTTLLVLLENDIIDNSQLSEWICPLIAQLVTSENTPSELRLEDVSVMCKMMPYVGKEITEKFFLEPFLSLCRGSSPEKEVCMLNFGNICQVIGKDATETTLLSAFLDFCQEELWQTKLKCVDIAVDLASVVSSTTRNEILSPIYMSFLKDNSRAVSHAAYLSLCRFISTFADPSKTGLNYSNGKWIAIPVDDHTENDDHTVDDHTENEEDGNIINNLNSDRVQFSQVINDGSFKKSNRLYHMVDDKFSEILSPSEVNNCHLNLEKNADGDNDDDNNDGPPPSSLSLSSFEKSDIEVLKFDFTNCDCNFFGLQKLQEAQPHYKNDTGLGENSNKNLNDIEMCNVENSRFYERDVTNSLSSSSSSRDRHMYVSIDNENVFNNFQFWRTPLPEVELDIDGTSNNLRTKSHETTLPLPSSKSNERISLNETKQPGDVLQESDNFPKDEDCDSNKLLNKNHLARYLKGSTSFPKESKNEIIEKEMYNNDKLEKIQTHVLIEEKRKSDKENIVYDQDIVPPELLLEFLDSATISSDGEMREILAYHFPSLSYTLGRKHWACIRGILQSLACDYRRNIQNTIASSLHELAVILGPDITTKDLLPVFLSLLEDPNLRYSSSLVMNISLFLKELKPRARRKFLPLIQGICSWDEKDSNWRYRLTVAEQFIPCVDLFASSEVLNFLPVCLLLLQDKVSAVRLSAVELLAVIIKSMVANSKPSAFLKAALCSIDEKYRKANKWLWRQLYVYICQELAVKRSVPREYFVDEIVPNLFSLAWDTVPNVRLAVARCLGLTLVPLDFLPSIQKAHYQLLLQVMYSLQSDVDRDVRHFALLSAAAFNVLPPKKEAQGSQFQKCEEWWKRPS